MIQEKQQFAEAGMLIRKLVEQVFEVEKIIGFRTIKIKDFYSIH